MRVVIHQSVALGPRTGIGHYTAELLRSLRELQHDVAAFPTGLLRTVARTCLYARNRKSKPAPQAAGRPGMTTRLRPWVRSVGRAALGAGFRLHCMGRGYQLYHEPNYIPLPCDLPTVATIHDLSVLHNPRWHPVGRVREYEERFQRGLSQCQHFFAVSEFTRQEMIRHLQIPADRITRTYNGVRSGMVPMASDGVAAVLRRLGLPPRYLLYLGTLEPRKNIGLLLRAYCALPDHLRRQWPLLLVGNWGWNTGELAGYLQDEARHRGVIHVGYVDDQHLAAIYNGARALVYPSLYEGFGLPPVEMMACGGAVLASTAGALMETVGSQGHLIPAEDVDGWRDAMARIVSDDDWWQALRLGATEAARRYTWERCALDTLRVYRRLCGVCGDDVLPMDVDPERRRAAG
ncbi:MAG: glycosyltransferase family 4 protein [Gemmataceae bacterium]|nr:glycosyltransferase family 4 protein [Gemmataceae bacterium]